MAKNVLLLGRTTALLDQVQKQLDIPDVRLFTGVDIDDLRGVFATTHIDHIIMGAGVDLDRRLDIIRLIFESSTTTTVHMKDVASGPESFLPFIRSILTGLHTFTPHPATQ